MSDLSLSQEEIDALLSGGGGPQVAKRQLSDHERTTFKKFLTEAAESYARSLSGMVEGASFSFQVDSLELTDRDGFLDHLSKEQEIVELRVDLSGDITCQHGIYLSSDHALALAGPVLGQQDVELNGTTVNALEEVASQMTAAFVNLLSSQLGKNVTPASPVGQKMFKALIATPDDDLVTIRWSVTFGKQNIQIVEFFTYDAVQKIVGKEPSKAGQGAAAAAASALGGAPQPGPSPQMPPQAGFTPGFGQQGMPWGMPGMQPAPGMAPPGPMPGMPGGVPPNMMGPYPGTPMVGMPPGQMPYYPNVQAVQFSNLNQVSDIKDLSNIGLLMDVTMEVSAELGRAKRQIKDILGMGEGTIIQLDKLAGEPVDILVNGKLIAKGEVVVIDENFGVRVTEIVTSQDKGKES